MDQLTMQRMGIKSTGSQGRHVPLGILLVGVLLANLDAVMVNIALPAITTYYNVPVAQSQWSVTGYLLATSSLLIVFGKVSERVGKAKVYLAGFAIFTISSLACGLAGSILQLIVFRIVQGVGGAMVYGVVGALLYEASPPEERGRAMGYVASTAAAATMIGPVLSGFITDQFGWQCIFLINVPIGIVLLAMAIKYLDVSEVTVKSLDMDWIGAGALAAFVTSLLLFFSELADATVTPVLIACGLALAASLAVFVIRESRCRTPLLDLSIFRNKKFSMPVASLMLFYAALNVANIVGPFYFEGVMGFTPSQVGLVFMLVPLLMFLASPVGGWLYDRHRWKSVSGSGALLAAVSYPVQCVAFIMGSLWLALVAFAIRGVGSGIFQGPNNTEVLDALPAEHRAVASSAASTARYLGIALGVSLSGLLLTAGPELAGYHGPLLQAGSPLLSGVTATAVFVAGILCALSAACAVSRNT